MYLPAQEISADQVLQAFYRDAPNLLLYTDGLIEAANANGDFFGQHALSALLRQTAALPPSTASDQIISSVQQWSASQDDDLTVLVCDYAPA
ncbi:MAG: SpoIIE family protein phosphatase [Candidatus Sulfotelmatobacter sp.]